LRAAPFYVTGESYAGHYVPAVASYINEQNKKLPKASGERINLRGIGIGNGLTDPLVQYAAYADYVKERGLIGSALRDVIQAAYDATCYPALLACKELDVGCTVALATCNTAVVEPLTVAIEAKLKHQMNPYNVTGPCEVPPLCYDFSAVTEWAQDPGTPPQLNISLPSSHEWQQCSAEVHTALTGDWMRDLETVVPGMLADGIRVLVYAGEDDFICNYLGNARWVAKMDWAGHDAYNEKAQSPAPWVVDGEQAGTAIEQDNLTFLRVFKAGHMVPMDQPKNALDMLERLISGAPFANAEAAMTHLQLPGRRAGGHGLGAAAAQ
jgi:carboxypeptidase C (cathepsin A)